MQSKKIVIPVSKGTCNALCSNALKESVPLDSYVQRLLKTSEHINPLFHGVVHSAVVTVNLDERYYAELRRVARGSDLDFGQVARILLTSEMYVKDRPSVNLEAARIGESNLVNPTIAPHAANAIETSQISKYRGKGGHGFAAEDANNLADQLRSRRAKVVGQSNEARGPDRVVDGVKVQSKYWSTPAASVNAAFDSKSGLYRYAGQVLEVPKDQYDQCVRLMREKILSGKVPGVTDPNRATDLVKSGSVTYKQTRNIARAGNIDSLKFDAQRACIESSSTFGISFGIHFAQAKWQGKSNAKAVELALKASLKDSAHHVITAVVTRQILRTQAAAIGAVSIRSGVKVAYQTGAGRAAIHRIAAGSLGKAVYGGAAINHVSKLVRTNIVTAVAVTAIAAGPDFYRAAFSKSISWQQFIKNTAVNAASVAAGAGGYLAGAAAGAAVGSVIPGPGTAAGAIVGGIIVGVGAGVVGHKIAGGVADRVVEDDAKKMTEIINDEMPKLAHEYMFTQAEVKGLIKTVSHTVDAKWLRGMFRKSNKGKDRAAARRYARKEFEPAFQRIIRRRPAISPPSARELERGVTDLVDELELADDVAVD